jgi:hypothetical protein
MAVPIKRGLLRIAIFAGAMTAAVLSARADEIRLKDGKKLYGVIVAYDDNMFKVKTDFGYVLVEKDKIASIIPTTPATPKAEPAAKKEAGPEASKPAADSQPKAEPPVASSAETTPTTANASTKSASPGTAEKREKATPKITNAAVKPELPANVAENTTVAPAIKEPAAAPTSPLATPAAAPAPPEVPAIREEIQGNLYTNYTHGFRMYKAPSWNLLDDARKALPNAIVAMGTSNESTLMVVGQEKTKEPLDVAATAVEKRLREIYDNYQQISRRKTIVGGLPAVEFRYRGLADEHIWSGTLAVVARGSDIFTALGMTYADSDLIQIQENVIARAITSLDFNAH